MATNSTRSSSNKKARAKERATPYPAPEVSANEAVPENVWRIGIVVIFLIAAGLRLYDLNLVPLHHDEGVNGNFLVRLVREGYYQYDPENYHGPTLYYFSALIPWTVKLLFGSSARDTYGLTTFSIRLIPALFGLATIALVFMLRRRLGTVATLMAGLLLAVSPGAVYLSRYFIHESLFVFFTLGIVVAGLKLYDDRNPAYLIPAGASAALLFATKETAMISAGVLIIALALTLVYLRWNSKPNRQSGRRRAAEPGRFSAFIDELGGNFNVAYNLGLGLIVFLALYLLFYSSFLTNNKGITDSLQTFAVWTRTGRAAHVHPASQYVIWLLREEAPLLFLGAIGAALIVLKPKNSFALFSALWAFGLLAAYSLIPYKTPWLMLNFVVPLALIGGYAIQAIYELDHLRLRVVGAIFVVAIVVATSQSIDLNFTNYDNDNEKYVYVYAHSKREMLDLVKQVEAIAKENNGSQTGITIVSPDYWPLPWYFRNFQRVGYFGRMAASSEPIIIANEN
ncbi:MAG TPA: flippase activity-associated protein Agl23, partial [Pyrinomonadaceae bacterium]|nr:flippase activity-associated protein Agl23 [Pyrinomonadaceae bacterium]